MWSTIPFLKSKCFLLVFIGISLLFSCKNQNKLSFENEDNGRVAKVGDVMLYEKDVEDFVHKEVGGDSVALRERFINNWIRKELLLQTARLNLSEKELDIEERVEDYRASLIINQYKQRYLTSHLDTLVTEEDIAMYVAEYPDSFLQREPLYRYYLAKVLKKNSSDIKLIRSLFSQKEINLMQDFNLANTTVISNYDVDWYTADEILKQLPSDVSKKKIKSLQVGKILSLEDQNTVYFLRPVEISKEGTMSPQKYIQGKVREIILHNRKIALAKQLEYEIYEVAKSKSQFEVY